MGLLSSRLFECGRERLGVLRPFGLLLAVATLLSICTAEENTRNILILHGGSANLPANLLTSKAFRRDFGSDMRNQLFEEYFDVERLAADDETIATELKTKYASKRLQLVVSVGEAPFKFLLQRGEQLWPDTPKVFGMVDLREVPTRLPPNLTGVGITIDFKGTLQLALQLMPDTRRVFYVGGVSPREKIHRSFAERDFEGFAGRVEFTYFDDLALSDLLDRLGQLPANSIVIYSSILQDVSGRVYVPARVCPLVASASNAPVFGPFNTYLGCGIVGGATVSFEDAAEQMASLGLRVLKQGTTTDFPIENSPSRVMVDWRQLQRWAINERKAPSGTIILFRTSTLWEQYKWFLIAGVVMIIALSGTVAALAMEIRRRKKSDVEIRSLSGRLINAGEEERKRIARELHDDISQRLALLSAELAGMDDDIPVEKAATRPSLKEPLQRLNGIIGDVHALARQLHSSTLQLLGLEAALRALCQQLARQQDKEIHFTSNQLPSQLREDLMLCFYRVAQEALNNSLKHSGATHIEVKLVSSEGILTMRIKDNGCGFESSAVTNGLGLATMTERLRLLEGNLKVLSKPGRGTEVTAQARLESA